MMFKQDLIKATGAVVLKDELEGNTEFGISTDTRTISNKDMYLPLKGVNFDGEKFIQNAFDAGAKAYFTTTDEVLDWYEEQLANRNRDCKIADYVEPRLEQ